MLIEKLLIDELASLYLYVFVSLFQNMAYMGNFRIGNGFDVHLLADGLTFTLGGIEIEHSKGCVAHSDGDVAIHALCDALLGSLSLGDIGHLYPDTSDEFKGIDSKILLERTYKIIIERGWRLSNADITIILQRPKIAQYIEKMKSTLMEVIDKVEGDFAKETEESNVHQMSRISVKATTTEKVGFVGREEGIAAYASVLLVKKFA